jgi:perosamine synthetase
MVKLGYNYRLTDIQCALGLSQLQKLPEWARCRQKIARYYDTEFEELSSVRPLAVRDDVSHAYHLYVVQFDLQQLSVGRTQIFSALLAEGIGVNVHYIPVHLHPYYQETLGTGPGLCPVAEAAYQRIITLPIFPAMGEADAADVVVAVRKVTNYYARV